MEIREYSNGEITVLWEAKKCTHSGMCVRTLPSVFVPKDRPWIKMDKTSSEEIINAVKKCPSGALSIKNDN